MSGTLNPSTTPEPVPRPAFLRQRDWQIWRESYLVDTPADARGAWVRSAANAKDKSRLALVHDISLGGIELRSPHPFESGSLLHVEIWDPFSEHHRSFLVRVLRVTSSANEFRHSCALLSMPARRSA